MIAMPEAVLEFWFGRPPLTQREAWFKKSPEFDAAIRARFLDTHAAAMSGVLAHWCAKPRGALAYVVVLDQFSRNMFRDTPAAFASDSRALAASKDIVWRRWDRAMHPFERQFAYLPFEHAEDPAMQIESLRYFGALEAFAETRGLSEWAEKHAVIVERFGRFPHRNEILGRVSTPEEHAFLLQPGSAF